MARAVHAQLVRRLRAHYAAAGGDADAKALGAIERIEITVRESDVAYAEYSAPFSLA
jgi:hypothetical protein